MTQVTDNQIPDALVDLDWHDITCESTHGCTNRATHIVHLHAVDECDHPSLDSAGNIVDIVCIDCLYGIALKVEQHVQEFADHPDATCLTCGVPVRELTDIIREVAVL
jgi:hypothetical protein